MNWSPKDKGAVGEIREADDEDFRGVENKFIVGALREVIIEIFDDSAGEAGELLATIMLFFAVFRRFRNAGLRLNLIVC